MKPEEDFSCDHCTNEFTIIGTSKDDIMYCPFCAAEMEFDEDDLEEEDD